MFPADFEEKIISKMLEYRITPPDGGILQDLNKNIRFNPDTGSTQSGSLKARYYIEESIKNPGTYVCHVQDFSSSEEPFTVFENNNAPKKDLTPQEIQRREEVKKRNALLEIQKRKKGRETLKWIAKNTFRTGSHPYLTLKGFSKEEQAGLDIISNANNELILPVRNASSGKTMNCQRIIQRKPDFYSYKPFAPKISLPIPNEPKFVFMNKFDKRFVKHCIKKNGYYLIDGNEPNKPITDELTRDSLIGLAEGYATGLEAHLLLGIPVIVGFDADNIKEVAKTLVREKNVNPENLILFADNDLHTSIAKPWLGNKGLKTANDLKVMLNIDHVKPLLDKEKHSMDFLKKVSDFNDLRMELGKDFIRKSIDEQIEKIIISRSTSREEILNNSVFEDTTPHAFDFYMSNFSK